MFLLLPKEIPSSAPGQIECKSNATEQLAPICNICKTCLLKRHPGASHRTIPPLVVPTRM
jgi:hypothetical protein